MKSIFMKSVLFLSLGLQALTCANASSIPTHRINPDDFFYSQQTSLWILFKVPKAVIQAQVGETLLRLGLEPATFEDPSSGYVILKPMVFSAEFGSQTASIPGTSESTELEVTLLVYPKGQRRSTTSTFDDFILGHAPPVGQLRLGVLCDNPVAVAAGRELFGEHKFLASFEYSYTTPNEALAVSKPFSLDFSVSTWQGAGQPDHEIVRIQATLAGLKTIHSNFSQELLFAAFPPEPQQGTIQKAVGEHRYYGRKLKAYLPLDRSAVSLSFGDAKGGQTLAPVPPYGNGLPIPGSDLWPVQTRDLLQALLSHSPVAGFLLFQPRSVEYETQPFAL